MVNAEVNKEIIIKMIGHKRYKTTLDIYVHKNYDDMKKQLIRYRNKRNPSNQRSY